MKKEALLSGILNFFDSGPNDYGYSQEQVRKYMEDYRPIDLISDEIDKDSRMSRQEKEQTKKQVMHWKMHKNRIDHIKSRGGKVFDGDVRKDDEASTSYTKWFIEKGFSPIDAVVGEETRKQLMSNFAKTIGLT